MKLRELLAVTAAAFGLAGCTSDRAQEPAGVVPATEMADPARGRLLYGTACAECHNRETHWRGQHLVRTWPQLLELVASWQSVAGQNWSQEEIEDVAAYLNRLFYDLPCPLPRCAAGTVG